jgi:hypothetical protein
VLGILARHHTHDLNELQRNVWMAQISLLQTQFSGMIGWLALEFVIPRMGRRADAVVLTGGLIFVIEFKIGADQYSLAARDQVVDYALDLKNFHAGSHSRYIVPVLVATGARASTASLTWDSDFVAAPLLANADTLRSTLVSAVAATPAQSSIEYGAWVKSGYKPTPTIIEAAKALYAGHRVDAITRSDADATNLSVTNAALAAIIEDAKAKSHKAICFVTGVPGAGKTLAGLNLATQRMDAHADEHAVFLSGNGPLVDVLREALARDELENAKLSGRAMSKGAARSKVKAFIQNIHHFRDDNLQNRSAPVERVAIFDEAQRAWDRPHASKFMAQKRGVADFAMSEPEFLISVMDRHQDWCVIVCLVGGGQEINAGEAGLTEWFSALSKRFPGWRVYTSPALAHRDYHWGQNLAELLSGNAVTVQPELHLAVSIRSFRAEKLSQFVGDVIAGDAPAARLAYESIRARYPIVLTRSLSGARRWLRQQARGSERFGLVASSGASRLKPEGINVHEKITAAYWFLNDKADVRSSYYLEDPATEFDIQGLELDWIAVCWDADMRVIDSHWSHHSFRGTGWQRINSVTLRAYLSNAYRVLLTRARQGMVLYVPRGDPTDPTRLPAFYDGIAAFLTACGVESLDARLQIITVC